MEPEKLKALLYWSGLFTFLLLEIRFSYRPLSVSKFKRWLTNLPLSVANGIIYHLVFFTAISGILLQTEMLEQGLLNSLPIPFQLKVLLGIIVLDFTIYAWHLLNHEVPFLWRFHRVHHSDLNMDASTANRFHIGELLMSGLLRLAAIYTFGIPLISYIIFEILVNLSIQFHHSSIRVEPLFEKLWILLFVPPSMHRIHHSVVIRERDSNYGVIFSAWDRFLGTLTREIDQDRIVIGLGSHRDFSKLGFWHVWLMPFTRQSK